MAEKHRVAPAPALGEVRAMLHNIALADCPEELRRRLARFDTNGNGVIDAKKATHNDPAKCKFVDYPDLPVTQYWNYDGENGALGYMNMERIGTTGTDVLVGYATKIKHKDSHFPPLEYRVAKISGTTGKVMMTKRLKKTGWGEEDHFKRTKDGCVLFPSVWNSAPGASYGNNGADGAAGLTGFSSKIRISKICDKAT